MSRLTLLALLALMTTNVGCVSHMFEEPGTFSTKSLAALERPMGETVEGQSCGRLVVIIPAGMGTAESAFAQARARASEADTYVSYHQSREDFVLVLPVYYQDCVRVRARPVDGDALFADLLSGAAADGREGEAGDGAGAADAEMNDARSSEAAAESDDSE